MGPSWWRRNRLGLWLAFAVFGLLAGAGVVVFPSLQTTLFVLYWTFLFAAVLLWFLTPERRVPWRVAERVYSDLAANESALVAAYDLQGTSVYVPDPGGGTEGEAGNPPARLFVPRYADDALPEDDRLQSLFVAAEGEGYRGLSFVPSGGSLFREFESMLDGDLSESPEGISRQLADGVTEGFELADRVSSDVSPVDGRVTFDVSDGVYGPIDRFDHPVQSFLAVGLAVGLDRPIVVESTPTEGTASHVVKCRWPATTATERETTVPASRASEVDGRSTMGVDESI